MYNMYFTSTFWGVYDVWSTYLGTNANMRWVYIAICNCKKTTTTTTTKNNKTKTKTFSRPTDPCPDKWLVDNQTFFFIFGLMYTDSSKCLVTGQSSNCLVSRIYSLLAYTYTLLLRIRTFHFRTFYLIANVLLRSTEKKNLKLKSRYCMLLSHPYITI